jgi:hypothetical protein
MVPMLGLIPLRPCRYAVAVDVDGHEGCFMPRVEYKTVEAGFLSSLPKSGARQIVRRLVMTARLKPAPKGTVVDQEDAPSCPIEDECRGRDMPGIGAAGMNVIPAFDLATEDSVSVIGHTEGPGVIVEDRSDVIPEGCRIETHG